MIERILRSSGSQGSLPDKLCIFVFPKIRCLLKQRSTSWGGRVWDKPQKTRRKIGIFFLSCSFGVFRKNGRLIPAHKHDHFCEKSGLSCSGSYASEQGAIPDHWAGSDPAGQGISITTTWSLCICLLYNQLSSYAFTLTSLSLISYENLCSFMRGL